ncbi:DUF992 domain-containing protein [Rhodoblastus sp.]|uniref:DUF992 domain-containing protein n=2 Tax=Rhodoblastus sp. TaxID=1962975 RepID=UPI003F97D628
MALFSFDSLSRIPAQAGFRARLVHKEEYTMLTRSCLYAASVAAMLSSPLGAAAQEAAKVGLLRCNVAPGMGLIIASQRDVSCIFYSDNGRRERYAGSIGRLGLDLGPMGPGQLAWEVFAPTARPYRGALAGEYEGVGASVTLGEGVGANALVGGNGRSFELQPVSVQTQTGANVAGGIENLTLRPLRSFR